jgi:hypothetical protein
MENVNTSELAAYNETDWACGGGFYDCPECGEQNYISESYDGMISNCCKCNIEHKFIE